MSMKSRVHPRFSIAFQMRSSALPAAAGLIKRVNNDVLDTAAQPQYVGKDLKAVADQIIARNG